MAFITLIPPTRAEPSCSNYLLKVPGAHTTQIVTKFPCERCREHSSHQQGPISPASPSVTLLIHTQSLPGAAFQQPPPGTSSGPEENVHHPKRFYTPKAFPTSSKSPGHQLPTSDPPGCTLGGCRDGLEIAAISFCCGSFPSFPMCSLRQHLHS